MHSLCVANRLALVLGISLALLHGSGAPGGHTLDRGGGLVLWKLSAVFAERKPRAFLKDLFVEPYVLVWRLDAAR